MHQRPEAARNLFGISHLPLRQQVRQPFRQLMEGMGRSLHQSGMGRAVGPAKHERIKPRLSFRKAQVGPAHGLQAFGRIIPPGPGTSLKMRGKPVESLVCCGGQKGLDIRKVPVDCRRGDPGARRQPPQRQICKTAPARFRHRSINKSSAQIAVVIGRPAAISGFIRHVDTVYI